MPLKNNALEDAKFQPTPSLRRATRLIRAWRRAQAISTHALLAEGDAGFTVAWYGGWQNFNPRPPCGGRHTSDEIRAMRYAISTHALLAEGDICRRAEPYVPAAFQPTPSLRRATPFGRRRLDMLSNFNPRPPCGGRPVSHTPGGTEDSNFNPRPPCGGRPDLCGVRGGLRCDISTHALLAEGDLRDGRADLRHDISTHALLAEGDR